MGCVVCADYLDVSTDPSVTLKDLMKQFMKTMDLSKPAINGDIGDKTIPLWNSSPFFAASLTPNLDKTIGELCNNVSPTVIHISDPNLGASNVKVRLTLAEGVF